MILIHLHPTHQKGFAGFPNPHNITRYPRNLTLLSASPAGGAPPVLNGIQREFGAQQAGASRHSLAAAFFIIIIIFNVVSNSREGLVPGQYLKEVLLNLSILCDKDDHSFIHQAFSEYLLCSGP